MLQHPNEFPSDRLRPSAGYERLSQVSVIRARKRPGGYEFRALRSFDEEAAADAFINYAAGLVERRGCLLGTPAGEILEQWRTHYEMIKRWRSRQQGVVRLRVWGDPRALGFVGQELDRWRFETHRDAAGVTQDTLVDAIPAWQDKVDPDLMGGCLYVGGSGYPALCAGSYYQLRFSQESIRVNDLFGGEAAAFAMAAVGALLVDGPGKVTTGPQLFGGGFGIKGALTGIVVAETVNALLSRTSCHTFIRIETRVGEAVFHYDRLDPQETRLFLSRTFTAIRAIAQGHVGPSPGDIVVRLDRLVELHEAGKLTDREFELAKQRLLQSD